MRGHNERHHGKATTQDAFGGQENAECERRYGAVPRSIVDESIPRIAALDVVHWPRQRTISWRTNLGFHHSGGEYHPRDMSGL